MGASVILLFYIGFPALAIYLAHKIPAVNKVGAVVVCNAAGIAAGNVGLIPESAGRLHDAVTTAAIPIALPLMFFSLDLRQWFKAGTRALLSFDLEIVSVAVLVSAGYFIFRKGVGSETWKLAGMLSGVYTGVTINVAAHVSDIVVSAIFLLFTITVGQRVLGTLLPPFKPASDRHSGQAGPAERGGPAAQAEPHSPQGDRGPSRTTAHTPGFSNGTYSSLSSARWGSRCSPGRSAEGFPSSSPRRGAPSPPS